MDLLIRDARPDDRDTIVDFNARLAQETEGDPDQADSVDDHAGPGVLPGSEDRGHRDGECGRTDRTHPELDFRYCSKCAGDQCYCPEHIHRHEHIVAPDEPAGR